VIHLLVSEPSATTGCASLFCCSVATCLSHGGHRRLRPRSAGAALTLVTATAALSGKCSIRSQTLACRCLD
jgi:hypothetical protein